MIKILIFELRAEKNLSLIQLEQLSGVSHSQINNIENGYSSPTLATLELIANGLGCRIKDLFEEQ